MSSRRLRSLAMLASLVWLVSPPATADTTSSGTPGAAYQPIPFHATYDGRYGLLSGRLVVELEHIAGDEWQMTSTLTPSGVGGFVARLLGRGNLVERSRMRITPDGILPLHYERFDGISGPDRNASLRFLYDEGRVVGHDREDTVDLPLQEHLLDRIAVQMQMTRDVFLGLRRDEYLILDRGEIEAVEITYASEEPLIRIGDQDFRTVVLEHSAPGSSRATRIWAAPELMYLPVRVEQTRDGSTEWSGVLSELRWYDPPAGQ